MCSKIDGQMHLLVQNTLQRDRKHCNTALGMSKADTNNKGQGHIAVKYFASRQRLQQWCTEHV